LAGVTLTIPPLRDRPEDLQPIADSLFFRYGEGAGGEGMDSTAHLSKIALAQARFRAWLAGDAARALPSHGNVRERARLMRTFIPGLTDGDAAPRDGAAAPRAAAPAAGMARFLDAEATLREVEDWYILHVLASVDYRQRRAAEILGVDRGTLARR